MWNLRPLPPLYGENHLKFPFWLFEYLPKMHIISNLNIVKATDLKRGGVCIPLKNDEVIYERPLRLLNRNISMSIIQSEDHFFADYDKEEPQLWLTVSIIWDDKITRGRNTLTKSLSTWEEHMGTRGRNTWKTLRKYSDIPRYVGRRSFQRKHYKSEQTKYLFFCAGSNIFCVQVPSQPACGGTRCREMRPVE